MKECGDDERSVGRRIFFFGEGFLKTKEKKKLNKKKMKVGLVCPREEEEEEVIDIVFPSVSELNWSLKLFVDKVCIGFMQDVCMSRQIKLSSLLPHPVGSRIRVEAFNKLARPHSLPKEVFQIVEFYLFDAEIF